VAEGGPTVTSAIRPDVYRRPGDACAQFPLATVRRGLLNGLLGIASGGSARDEAAVHVMVPGNHEHALDGTSASLCQFFEPSKGCCIFLWVSLERDGAANNNRPDRTQDRGARAGILNDPLSIRPIWIEIRVQAVRCTKMDVGNMEYQHRRRFYHSCPKNVT
jgi:hypothetical protein